MKTSTSRILLLPALLAMLFTASAPSPLAAQNAPAPDAPAMVILVRHAEKAAVPGNDPPLSEAGQARAKALALVLADANVTSIIVTTYKRTNETGLPLATARGIKAEVVGLEGGTATHVAAVAAAVRKHAGEVVLVVGHSNTIPAIITALGGPKMPDICDASYANLFVLEPGKQGTAARLVRAKYGVADAENAEQCAGMTPR